MATPHKNPQLKRQRRGGMPQMPQMPGMTAAPPRPEQGSREEYEAARWSGTSGANWMPYEEWRAFRYPGMAAGVAA